MAQLQCHRCEYEWDYLGESDYYATCPNCKTTVSVEGETHKPSEFHEERVATEVGCNYGEWLGPDLSEVDTKVRAQLEEFEGDKWLTLYMFAEAGDYAQTKLSVVFDDSKIAKEFGEKIVELSDEIDSVGDGTEKLS